MATERQVIVDYLVRRSGGILSDGEIKIIPVARDSVKYDQARILSNSLGDEIYSVIVLQLFFSHPTGEEEEPLYQFSYEEWLKFKIVNRKYRVIPLSLTRPIKLSSNSPPVSLSSSLRLTVSQEIPLSLSSSNSVKMENPHPLSFITPLSFPLVCGQGETTSETVINYVSLFFDFMMIRRELPKSFASLERRWLKYIKRHSSTHSTDAILFLKIYTKAIQLDKTVNLLREWILFEIYLFRKSPLSLDSSAFHSTLQKHKQYLAVKGGWDMKKWQHHYWHEYGDWESVSEEGWRVNVMWLFEKEFEGLQGKAVIENGFLLLNTELLHSALFPCIYRHMLMDMTSLLCDLQKNPFSQDYYDCYHPVEGGGGSLIYHLYQLLTQDLPQFTIATEVMYQFNVNRVGSFSPFTHAMSMHYEAKMKKAIENGVTVTTNGKKPLVSSQLDMEDLFRTPSQVLPPCLSQVFSLNWYKNTDRWQMICSLIDMGYRDREKIADLVCRNNPDPMDRKIVQSLFDSSLKKKMALEKDSYRIAYSCDKLIDSQFEKGNVLRCVYEKEKNGENRCLSLPQEKASFREKCASGCGKRNIWSPLEFIEQRVFVVK